MAEELVLAMNARNPLEAVGGGGAAGGGAAAAAGVGGGGVGGHEHAEIIDKSDNDVSIDTQTSVVTGGHKEKRRGIHVVDANESESSRKDRENDNNKRVHSSGLNGKPEASHIDSDSPRAAHISLSKRRRRLIDIFQFSKYNVLDAARRELWDEIEKIRQDATEDKDASTGETEACIDESVRIGDESMRKRYRWCEEAWKQLFEELILSHTLSSMQSTRDDILYFVQSHQRLRSRRGSSDSGGTSMQQITKEDREQNQNRLIVRRWNSVLPADIESMSDCFQWQHSLLLNLILQTQYVMTIAVYDIETLNKKRDLRSRKMSSVDRKLAEASFKPVMEMKKRVYASPHFENFDNGSASFKGQDSSMSMQESYPTLYFSVNDNYDSEEHVAFDSVILADPNCFCVILNASLEDDVWGRSAMPQQASDQRLNPKITKSSVKLFSGFVTHTQVSESYQENVGWKNYFKSNSSTRLAMRGPRGKGRAEVAVRDYLPDRKLKRDRESQAPDSGGIIRKMANLTVRNVVNVAKEAISKGKDNDKNQLTCSLVSLELPWEAIAYDLLKIL